MMTEEKTTPENGPDESDNGLRSQFLLTLLSKRSEAISGRLGSGIEIEWQEDEEHYQGIDDANRQFQSASLMSQPKRWATGQQSMQKGPTRSVLFLNITRPYVDAASARVSDMLLPTDDRSWEIKPTPMPRLTVADIQAFGGVDVAMAALEETESQAKAASEGMQTAIDDCLKESNWHGEVRQVIEDAARLGSGVLKGPYPIMRNAKLTKRGPDGLIERISISDIRPASKRIDPWNFFPDPACGGDIHNGAYTWEREYLSKRQIKEMLAMPGYDRSALIRAIKEGPKGNSVTTAPDNVNRLSEDQYEMWIFHGYCDTEHLQALGVEIDGEDGEFEDKLPAMAVMINDHLVKITLSALDSGDFPYDVLAWQARPGMPWGMGISRQIRTVQRMLNGSTRAMMDNSGLSAAPQIVLGNGVVPVDGNWALHGGKYWRTEPEAGPVTVAQAFGAFVVPSVQAEMMNIINFALKMAEDTTGMPAMLQGIRGDAPNTLGGMQMQNNNATSVLRRLAKRFDDYMTRPHIKRYFEWMMQHSEDDAIKGDFEIDVRASSALVERDAQQNLLTNMLAIAANPVYGLSPARLAEEILKGQRIDVKRLKPTDDEMAAHRAQPDPEKEAKARKLDAETERTYADIEEVKAKTATKNVEGMFSATEAAKNIATVPGIAPSADSIWKAAGGQDKDGQAPAIAPIDGGPVAGIDGGQPIAPPEPHTNPLTPANPQSPSEGMMAGIEGG